MSSIIPFLSSSLGCRDELPNIELANRVVEAYDKEAIAELIRLIIGNNRKLANDAIKVLYEVGDRAPALIQDHFPTFIQLLKSKINRLQWGSMIALNHIVHVEPDRMLPAVPEIVQAMEEGSIITKDHGIKILASLARKPQYQELIMPLLLEFIQSAPVNQFPTYAQTISDLKLHQYRQLLQEIVRSRLPEFEPYPSKSKKLLKLLEK